MKGEHTSSDLFSVEGLRSGGKKKDLGETASAGGLLGIALSLLGAKGSTHAILKQSMPVMELVGRRLPKKKIGGFFWEIISGYLKWRAVEAGIWGVKQVVKARKERKRFAREAELHHPIHQHSPIKKKSKRNPGMMMA
jgi:hypothetical protein